MDAEEGARGGAPSTSAMSPDGAGPAADPPVFSTVLVYATSARVYVVAGTSDKSRWRILNVSRALNADDSLEASEAPGEYDEAHCARVLATIACSHHGAANASPPPHKCLPSLPIAAQASQRITQVSQRRFVSKPFVGPTLAL